MAMHIRPALQPFLFALAAILGLSAFVAYDLHAERQRFVGNTKASTANVARLLEEHIRQSLRRVEALLIDAQEDLDESPQKGKPGRDIQAHASDFKRLLPDDGLVGSLSWLGTDDQQLALTGRPLGVADQALPDWVARAKAAPPGSLVLGRAWSTPSGSWYVPVGRRLARPDGQTVGALVAWLHTRTLQQVFEAVDTGKRGFTTLFLVDGWMLATAPYNEALFGKSWGGAPMFTEHLPRSPTGSVQQVVVRDGTERVYSYRALAEYPIVVSTGISMTDALAEWRTRMGWNALLLMLTSGLALLGATAMSRSYVRREAAERASHEAARQTQAVLEHAADGIMTCSPDGRVMTANQACTLMFGLNAAQLVGRQAATLLQDAAQGQVAQPQPVLLSNGARFESSARRSDGMVFPVEVAVSDMPGGSDGLRIVLIRDITEGRRARDAVAQARDAAERSQRFLQDITDKLPMRISYVDAELRYRFVNSANVARFGRPREAILGRSLPELTGQPMTPEVLAHVEKVRQGQDQRFEVDESRDGQARVIENFLVPDVDAKGKVVGFYAAATDITERKAQQLRIESALAERDTLLREVYHRVKNNLQVVQSLLNLRRRGLPDGEARSALDDSVQRVQAMALVHEKLYQTGHLEAIALGDYCADLLRHLGDTVGAAHRGVRLRSEVQSINVSLELAVPFGLLVTELVSNAFKHGFPAGRSGAVTVGLQQTPQGWTLSVRDDGVGLPAGFELDQLSSMGLQLAASLANQLGGRLQGRNDGGAVLSAHLSRLTSSSQR